MQHVRCGLIQPVDALDQFALLPPGTKFRKWFKNHLERRKGRSMGGGERKYVWVKPSYSKIKRHRLDDGSELRVKTGNQIIDRFWGHARALLKHRTKVPGSNALRARIRFAQFTYWHNDKDLWLTMGDMISGSFSETRRLAKWLCIVDTDAGLRQSRVPTPLLQESPTCFHGWFANHYWDDIYKKVPIVQSHGMLKSCDVKSTFAHCGSIHLSL